MLHKQIKKLLKIAEKSNMICSQSEKRSGLRRGLPKRLYDFKNFIVSLIISQFISKLYNFDPYNNKCKSLSLDI